MTLTHVLINFEQIDSWFFREARPHGSVGATALNSVFPPPTRTLMGALRSIIGHAYFKANPQYSWSQLDTLNDLKAVIGDANCLGTLQPGLTFIKQGLADDFTCYLPAPPSIFVQNK